MTKTAHPPGDHAAAPRGLSVVPHRRRCPASRRTRRSPTSTGVRVRYVDRGERSAPVVVLIHGFASSLETWDARDPRRSRRSFRVIALDLKGFGWTDRPEGDYSPQAQAKLVSACSTSAASRARRSSRTRGARRSRSRWRCRARARHAPRALRRVGLRGAAPHVLPLGARGRRRRDALRALLQRAPRRADGARLLRRSCVTEKLVEEVEDALDRPGTVAAALAAVRGQRYAELAAQVPHDREADAPPLGPRGRGHARSASASASRTSCRDAKLVVYPQCGHFPMIEADGRVDRGARRRSSSPSSAAAQHGGHGPQHDAEHGAASIATGHEACARCRARPRLARDRARRARDGLHRHRADLPEDREVRAQARRLPARARRGALQPRSRSRPHAERAAALPGAARRSEGPVAHARRHAPAHRPRGLRAGRRRRREGAHRRARQRRARRRCPTASRTRRSRSDRRAAIVRAASAPTARRSCPIGILAAGRMGSHWGLGMLANGGDCLDCDAGDAADRIAFVTPLARSHLRGRVRLLGDARARSARRQPHDRASSPTSNVRTVTLRAS